MELKKAAANAAVVGILAISLAFIPLALATASSSAYPFELTGRIEYVAPAGTTNPFGHAGQPVFDYAQPVALVESVAWVPASSYTTSPGHGL